MHGIQATRAGVRPGHRGGAAALGRGAPDPRRSRAQRRHHRERAALERSAAARHVRTDPGDPHLLRLRRGRQRPLHDQREVPADHAVGARAERAVPAEPHLDQRAPDVHPRLRPDPRPGQRGHRRRTAGALHPRSAPGVDRRSEGHPAGDLLRRAAELPRLRQDQDRGVRLPARRRQRLRHLCGQRRRAALERVPPPDVRDPVPLDRHVLLAEPDRGEPGDVLPPHRRTGAGGSRRSSTTTPIRT